MNVKTIKRISKRSVSMLLSVLMVLSLFTVCLVGTTVTAGAASLSKITVTLKGTAASWNPVYIIIGKSNYVESYAMTKPTTTGSTWTHDFGSRAFDFDSGYYFFSNSDGGVLGGTSSKSVTDVYNSISDDNKTGTHSSGGSQTKTDYSKAESYGWFDSTVWNYRNKDQISNNVDNKWGQANVPFKFEVYAQYNTAVADWFRDAWAAGSYANKSAGFTPLYQGNFRQGSATGENNSGTIDYVKDSSKVKDVFAWFVSVANGANRANSTNTGSAAAVAKGLSDSTLKGGDINTSAGIRAATVTQNGVEIPQFSDAFMNYYNGKTRTVEHAPNSNYDGMLADGSSYSFGTIQKKFSGLKFQFNKSTTSKGNTKYSYNAAKDGNRYVDLTAKQVKKGVNVYGCINDKGNRSTQAGYYPMNETNPSDPWDIVNCTGTRIDIDFAMPSANSGYKMKGTSGEYEDLTFRFAGDDDVWVYIDGYLALDLGGSHNNASGSINLSEFTNTIDSGYYDPTFKTLNAVSKTLYSGVNLAESGSKTTDLSLELQTSLKKADRDTHTMTIFYLERGTFDSNFVMEFMLPVVSDTTLSIDEKVDNSAVNTGLLSETLDSANKDIFSVNVKSDSIADNSSNNSTATLSTGTSFVRKDVVGTDSTTIQQGADASKDGTTSGFINSNNSTSTYIPGLFDVVNAYYKWTDSATNDNTSTGEALATGDGVGVPSNGNVFLQYGQKAMFTDQFDVNTKLQLVPSTYLYKYDTGYDLDTGLLNIENKTKPDSELKDAGQKKVADYYTTDIVVKDAKNQTLTPASDGITYNYANTGTPENKKAKVTATVTNKIKTSSFTVEKLLADGSINAKHKNDDFLFTVKASKIFGTEYKDDSNNTILKSVKPNFNVVKTLVVEETDKFEEYNFDEDNQRYEKVDKGDYILLLDGTYATYATKETKEEKGISYVHYSGVTVPGSYSTYKCKWNDTNKEYEEVEEVDEGTEGAINVIKLKAGQKAVFEGIPVDSVFEVEEISSDADLSVTIEDKTQGAVDSADVVKSKVETKNGDDKTAVVTVGTDVKSARAQVTNDFSKIPVLYRYYDRQIVSGKPTSKENHYTYYIKWIYGVSDTTITQDTITQDVRKKIVANAETIDNIVYKYTLSTSDASQYSVSSISDLKAITGVEGLSECIADIEAKGYDSDVIIATYEDSDALYTVTVYYPDSASGGQVKKETVKFNTSTSLGTAKAEKKATYTVNGSSKECTFGYWERLVTVRDGEISTSKWIPVTSNYDYAFRVTETTTLRAVYYYEDGGKKCKVAYGTDYEDSADSTFSLLDDVYGVYPVFNEYILYEYKYFHIEKIVVKHYDGYGHYMGEDTDTEVEVNEWHLPHDNYNPNDPQSGTYDVFTSEQAIKDYLKANPSAKENYPSNFKVESETIKEFDTSYYNKTVGNDATATDRTYDMYTKMAADNTVQSRTRINVIFGAAGSPDTDTEITNVGYILFKNTDQNTKYLYSNLDQDTLKGYVNSGSSGNRTVKTYNVAMISDGKNVDDYKETSGDNINLTNKNRYQIVFDTASDNTAYFTCYTFMIRKEKDKDGNLTGKSQIYVSNTPANFRALEAEYVIDTDTDVDKDYYINKSCVSATPGGQALGTIDVNSAVAVEGKELVIKATPLVSGDLKGKLTKLTIGKEPPVVDPNELAKLSSNAGYTFTFTEAGYIGDKDTSTILNIEAEFTPVANGITVTDPAVEGVTVAVSGYSVGSIIPKSVTSVTVTANVNSDASLVLNSTDGWTLSNKSQTATKTVTITDGMTDDEFRAAITPTTTKGVKLAIPTVTNVSSISVAGYSNGNTIPVGTTVGVSATAATGYKLTGDFASGSKSVVVQDGWTTDDLTSAITPTVTAITYTVTITTNDSTMGSASGTYKGGTASTITVSVPSGTTVNLSATLTDDTKYKFDKWTATAGNATFASSTSENTLAEIIGDTTITANFIRNSQTVYFAFIDQDTQTTNANYPKDGVTYFKGRSDDINSKYWKVVKTDKDSSHTYANGENMTYYGYMKTTIGGNTHYATVYKYTITSGLTTTHFYGGDGSVQSNNITVVDNAVYYADGSGERSFTHNSISNWTMVSGNTITFNSAGICYGNTKWALYCYNSNTDYCWIPMSSTGTTNQFRTNVPVPNAYANVIVVEMKSLGDIGWDNMAYNNQSQDINIGANTTITATDDWSAGKFIVNLS